VTAIAEFTLRAGDFPLGRVFEGHPETSLELDRVVPSGETVIPYFWVQDPDRRLGEIRAVFEGLAALRSVSLVDDLGELGLFRAEWEPDSLGIMSAIAATDVSVLSASGTAAGWTFELRAASAERFAEFQRYCLEHDVDLTLGRLSSLSEVRAADHGLTAEQREALALAYREGYYEEPRGTDLETLAATLGISRQALSGRLQRGYRTLVGNAVADEDLPDAPT
jgi:predicted DNA binding protein